MLFYCGGQRCFGLEILKTLWFPTQDGCDGLCNDPPLPLSPPILFLPRNYPGPGAEQRKTTAISQTSSHSEQFIGGLKTQLPI